MDLTGTRWNLVKQGIVNTAEAWRSLALIGSVIQEVKLPKESVKADCRQLIKEVDVHGFIRSPYYPSNLCGVAIRLSPA